MKKIIPFLPILILTLGCSTIPKAYITAERAAYRAIAPEYLRYVEEDPELSTFQKEIRRQTIQSWESRIRKAEVIYE